LTFQDAVYGPISYDMVSLLKDAYIEWDRRNRCSTGSSRYWERARKAGLPMAARTLPSSTATLNGWAYSVIVKVLGIFARLYHRDGKDGYLKDMPLVAKYLRKPPATRYAELSPHPQSTRPASKTR
jgi:aminoglycoside/choline kinase family phosphotransferase